MALKRLTATVGGDRKKTLLVPGGREELGSGRMELLTNESYSILAQVWTGSLIRDGRGDASSSGTPSGINPSSNSSSSSSSAMLASSSTT